MTEPTHQVTLTKGSETRGTYRYTPKDGGPWSPIKAVVIDQGWAMGRGLGDEIVVTIEAPTP